MPSRTSANGPLQVPRAQRRAQALQLRAGGATYEQIGAELGITKQAAHKMVQKALKGMVSHEVDELRKVEEVRLDAIHTKAFQQAIRNGDVKSMKIVLEVHDRRVRLFDLEAPKRIELDAETTFRVEELPDDKIRQIAKLLGIDPKLLVS